MLSIEYLNETSDNTEDNEESSAAHLLHEVAEAVSRLKNFVFST